MFKLTLNISPNPNKIPVFGEIHENTFDVSFSSEKVNGTIKASQQIPATTVAIFAFEKNTLNIKQYIIAEILYTDRNTKINDQSVYIDI